MTAVHESKKPYTRRTDDDRIAELLAKVEAIKARGERRQARANPAVKLTVGAVKLLDKALNATDDAAMKSALQQAMATLGECVSAEGVGFASSNAPAPEKKRRAQVAG